MALTFFWRAESTTFDGTHDFSAGDNTPTANETVEISSTQAFVGTNSVRAINGGDYYAFDSASIFSIAEGSAACSIYVNSSWDANGQNALTAAFGGGIAGAYDGTGEVGVRANPTY